MSESHDDNDVARVSRREFIETTGAAAAVVAATSVLDAQAPAAQPAISPDPGVPRTTIRVVVNGTAHRLEVEDRWTLAELLRDRLGLTGTKIGCDRGECGACTVLMDAKPTYSCSHLAVWADGREITTIEGLAHPDRLHPLQQAFAEHDAPQCGFCTSGQLMSATALLTRTLTPTRDEVRAALAGNLCRCANYLRYAEAVLAAAATMRGAPTAQAAGRGGAE
jgi:xanthine dehydrogenase YagT iron-sulfur-binding subunit